MGFTMKKNGSDKKHPFCISLLGRLAHMEKKDTTIWRFGRGALAIILVLLSIAVVLPNLWHPVSDNSVAPTSVLVRSFRDEVVVCVIPIIPLICIFAGMFR
jgi:hypothetical protein